MPSLLYTATRGAPPTTFELHKHVTSVGSDEDNDLVLRDEDIAATHALIRFNGKTFTLQCVTQGTYAIINGKRRARHTLEHGDEILLGNTPLHFHLHGASTQRAEATNSELADSYRRILDFARELSTGLSVPELLEKMMDSIIELTNADRGFLILASGDELDVRVARNVAQENVEDALDKVSDSIVSTVIRTRQPLIVADALNDAAFQQSLSVVNLKLCSVMCVPLIDRDQLIGLIYVGNDNVVNLFTDAHLQALTIYAAQASLILARALAFDELETRNSSLEAQLDGMRFGSIIGACDAMREVYRRVKKVAQTDVTVLVTGETGTGKELIAKEVHARSARSGGPFVTVNCGAIPENLLESELFGHTKGAFTGATAKRGGTFHAANGGTLFLDEIGEMPLNLQVKILRALQERTITRVGSTKPEAVDLRIVAATHRDLPAMIARGEFREDLYYRLNVISLHLPPLRERGDDVELLAQYLLERFRAELGSNCKGFATDAKIAMRKFGWPGNIRQLENHIKKALILSERPKISAADLDLGEDGAVSILPLAEAREAWQRSYIGRVLSLNDGNRTKTARDLGVDPRTIFRFLEKKQAAEEQGEVSEP